MKTYLCQVRLTAITFIDAMTPEEAKEQTNELAVELQDMFQHSADIDMSSDWEIEVEEHEE